MWLKSEDDMLYAELIHILCCDYYANKFDIEFIKRGVTAINHHLCFFAKF